MVYTLRFFSSKCSLFHNSNIFGSCIIHILYTGCAKIKKNNSGDKRLKYRKVTLSGIPLSVTFLYLKQNVLYWSDDDRLRSKLVVTV